jgi:hypothetical protein
LTILPGTIRVEQPVVLYSIQRALIQLIDRLFNKDVVFLVSFYFPFFLQR